MFGGIQLTGSYERATVRVDWGDGTQSTQQAGFNAVVRPDSPVTLGSAGAGKYSLHATHMYADPGSYTVTVTAQDLAGADDSGSIPLTIKGPQKITFGQLDARHYGDAFTVAATGTDSGFPVTYTAGPGEVCTADGESGSRITAVGIGTCTVTAHQAGGGEIYLDAAPVARSLEITPAGLDIRADDRSKTYGDPDPELTATLVGLKNGDTADDIGGLVLTGPPGDSDAGTYDIVASGASNPNYEIHYDPGKLQILPAPLTVTPDDRERVYGDPVPAYTADLDGLVNGDTAADITGLELTGPPPGAHVGTYAIHAGSATNRNYTYRYLAGTETVTPAPLTIRADDKVVKYGTTASYTWRGTGWVDGESFASLTTAPSCAATIQGTAATDSTAPGAYVGAITCQGAVDHDYVISYASAKLTINPVIRLAQTGLPATLPKKATIDGQAVTLPTGDVEVGYGTAHSYSFPGVVTGTKGVALPDQDARVRRAGCRQPHRHRRLRDDGRHPQRRGGHRRGGQQAGQHAHQAVGPGAGGPRDGQAQHCAHRAEHLRQPGAAVVGQEGQAAHRRRPGRLRPARLHQHRRHRHRLSRGHGECAPCGRLHESALCRRPDRREAPS